MSQWDNIPTSLIQFQPLAPEHQQQSLLTRFLRRKDGSGHSSKSSSAASSAAPSREASIERSQIPKAPSKASLLENNAEDSDPKESPRLDRARQDSMIESISGSQFGRQADRTLSSVLNRLRNIMERRTNSPQAYRDSDFKQYWMPDSSCKECYDCGDKFTTFRRRHHCRICGQIFCSKCCNQELPGQIIGYKGGIRVCTYCGKVALSALHNYPLGELDEQREDIVVSLEEKEDSFSKSSVWGSSSKRPSTLNKSRQKELMDSPGSNITDFLPFVLTSPADYDEAYSKMGFDRKHLEDSVQLRELWRCILDPESGVDLENHRVRLRTFNNCIVGNKLVDWLLMNDKAAQRVQAVAIGQALLGAGYLEPISRQDTFMFQDDFSLYRPVEIPSPEILDRTQEPETIGLDVSNEPEWLQQIDTEDEEDESTFIGVQLDNRGEIVTNQETETAQQKDYNLSVDTVSAASKTDEDAFDEPFPRQDCHFGGQDDVINDSLFSGSQTLSGEKLINFEHAWRNSDSLKEENEEKAAYLTLRRLHDEHIHHLASQAVSNEGVSKSWLEIILGTARRVSSFVHPDVKNDGDNMDIREYIKFKKIVGGTKEQTSVIFGVVFTKTVAHKKMAQSIANPDILLLKGAIEYQRVESKFSSLEPQILQEEEFLYKSVAKICSLKPVPNIVVVEKSVSRLAQNFLLEAGITLIFNVKMSVMERLERLTQTNIVNSIDGLVSGPISLGRCHTFKSISFTLPSGASKNLLCFDGCATHLGCTITLRGGNREELKKIKDIMKQIIYATYNSTLELSLCMDSFAMPPCHYDDVSDGWTSGYTPESESGPYRLPLVADIKPSHSQPSVRASESVIHENNMLSNLNYSPYTNSRSSPTLPLENVDENASVSENGNDRHMSVSSTDEGDESGTMFYIAEEFLDSYENIEQDKALTENSEATSSEKSESEIKPTGCESKQEMGHTEMSTDESVKPAQDLEPNVNIKVSEQKNSNQDSSVENTRTVKQESNNLDGQTKVSPDSEDGQAGKVKASKINQEDMTPTIVVQDVSEENSCQGIDGTSASSRRPPKQSDSLDRKKSPGVLLTDQSDPLTHFQKHQDDTIFQSSEVLRENSEKKYQMFKKMLGELTLNVSPFVKYDVPYLESRAGSLSPVRSYFPKEIYWSALFNKSHDAKKRSSEIMENNKPGTQGEVKNKTFAEAHPWVTCQMSRLDQASRLRMLADFRARGGQIILKCLMGEDPPETPSPFNSNALPSKEETPRKIEKRKKDCLNFNLHQRLAVLLSSHSEKSANSPFPCVPPQVIAMEFYGHQDITLGGFLESFCFKASYALLPYTCPSEMCEVPIIDHVRRIVHHRGVISISLRHLKNSVPGSESAIMMWNWCKKCRQATPLMPMCTDTWHISFAKYLELHFYGYGFTRRVRPETCTHSLFHTFNQYFGHGNIVATFKYQTISRLEIAPPPPDVLYIDTVTSQDITNIKDTVKSITNSGTDTYSNILEYIVNINSELTNEVLALTVADYKDIIQSEKTKLHDHSRSIREQIANIQHGMQSATLSEIDLKKKYNLFQDELVVLKKFMADSMINWKDRLQFLSNFQKKIAKQMTQKKEKESTASEEPSSITKGSGKVEEDIASSLGSSVQTAPDDEPTKGQGAVSNPLPIAGGKTGMVITETDIQLSPVDALAKASMSPGVLAGSVDEVDGNIAIDKISGIRKTISNFLTGSGLSLPQLPYDNSQHPLLPTGLIVPLIVYEQEPSSIIAYALSGHDYQQKLIDLQNHAPDSNSVKVEKGSGLTRLARVASDVIINTETTSEKGRKGPGSGMLSFMKSKEPTSSTEQKLSVQSVKYLPKQGGENVDFNTAEEEALTSSASTSDLEKSKSNKSNSQHIELQFCDHTARFYCKVYFAEQFNALRNLIFPSGNEAFIRSISRCRAWEAKGGKSGSTFCKTHDERFILKQMSGIEVDIFEKFGPAYFQYITKCHNDKKATALAKILGVFRIGFKNNVSNKGMKQDLLVMENLFYRRKITQAYDLKGSMRNRLASTSGKKGEEMVLLDENLLKLSVESPLYVYTHSRMVLNHAIRRDSEFLASNLVMDYSLLVGLDEERQELVVGIIDYIRTFTWDKKLETLIKSTGGKMPTVVSPEIYRNRFLEAMNRYFLQVPDQWLGLGVDVEL